VSIKLKHFRIIAVLKHFENNKMYHLIPLNIVPIDFNFDLASKKKKRRKKK